jgi:hypothetical protein
MIGCDFCDGRPGLLEWDRGCRFRGVLACLMEFWGSFCDGDGKREPTPLASGAKAFRARARPPLDRLRVDKPSQGDRPCPTWSSSGLKVGAGADCVDGVGRSRGSKTAETCDFRLRDIEQGGR